LLCDHNLIVQPRPEQEPISPSEQESKRAAKYKIYMPFPLECPLPERLQSVLKKVLNKRNLEMTHAQYVVDAVHIILTILYENVVTADYKQTKNARKIIGEIMDDYVSHDQIPVMFKGDAKPYGLDNYGSCNSVDYHLYSVELPGDLADLKNEDLEKAKWDHDKDCPTCQANKEPVKPTYSKTV
jgi:hypothetical protein